MLSAKKILIVDNEAPIVALLKARLEMTYRVSTALDGESGYQKAVQEKPDLILSDIMMPGVDGFELMEKLKQHTSTQHIPVIFVSALSDTSSIYKAQDRGVADYLIKPFDMEELSGCVKRYV